MAIKALKQKHIHFCNLVFLGHSVAKASKQAGLHPSTGKRLMNDPLVKLQIESLNMAADDEAIATVEERKLVLSEITRGRFSQFIGDTGEFELTKNNLDNPALGEIRKTSFLDKSDTVHIKLRDPIPAIAELNRMDGSYAPTKHAVASKVIFEIVHVEKKKLLGDGTEL